VGENEERNESGSVGEKIGEDCGRQVIRFSERVYMLARDVFFLFFH